MTRSWVIEETGIPKVGWSGKDGAVMNDGSFVYRQIFKMGKKSCFVLETFFA
jgi:hypothetical protein